MGNFDDVLTLLMDLWFVQGVMLIASVPVVSAIDLSVPAEQSVVISQAPFQPQKPLEYYLGNRNHIRWER